MHATWREGDRRRRLERALRTKRDAQGELTRFLADHQSGGFVAPSCTTLAECVEPWLDGRANRGGRPAPPSADRPEEFAHCLGTDPLTALESGFDGVAEVPADEDA